MHNKNMWQSAEVKSQNLPPDGIAAINLELRRIHSELQRLHIAITNQIHTLKQTVLQAPVKRCLSTHERNEVLPDRFHSQHSAAEWKSLRPAEVCDISQGLFLHRRPQAVSDSGLQKRGVNLFPKRSCCHFGSTEKDENKVECCSSFGCMSPGFSRSPGISSNSGLFNMKETSSKYSTFLCRESAVMSMTGMQQRCSPLNAPTAAAGVMCSPFLLQSLHNIKTTPAHHVAVSSDESYSALESTARATESDVIYCLPGPVIAQQLEDTVCVELQNLTAAVERLVLQLQKMDMARHSLIGQYTTVN
jgi:hypothetical protein